MKSLIKGMGVLIAVLISVSCTTDNQQMLAKKILNDSSFQVVDSMGRALLSQGFNAGSGYSQVWVRDMNTFIETACEVVNPKDIKGAILIFFGLQQSNGEIIDGYVLKEDFNWDDSVRYYSDILPQHVGFKNTVETDQETSLIQVVGKYIRKTGDRTILQEKIAGKTVYLRMEEAIDYLRREKFIQEYGLLTGALTADWGDVQAKDDGLVDINENSITTIDVYDNAMFAIALKDMAEMSEGRKRDYWLQLRKNVTSNIRKYLWDDLNCKFIPHLYPAGKPDFIDFDENQIHYHGGTAVAIEAGILEYDEIAKVNAQMLENVRLSGMPSLGLTIYPPYPDGFFHGGMSKAYIYQNGGDWTWFGGRMIQQLIVNGYIEEAYKEIAPMIERVIKNKGFFEWYGKDGLPYGSGHFKGSAGVLCKSIELFREWANNKNNKN